MLKTLRQHRVVRGCIEVLVDATRYVLVMLAVVILLGQLAKLAL
jgi:hypothetical protein